MAKREGFPAFLARPQVAHKRTESPFHLSVEVCKFWPVPVLEEICWRSTYFSVISNSKEQTSSLATGHRFCLFRIIISRRSHLVLILFSIQPGIVATRDGVPKRNVERIDERFHDEICLFELGAKKAESVVGLGPQLSFAETHELQSQGVGPMCCCYGWAISSNMLAELKGCSPITDTAIQDFRDWVQGSVTGRISCVVHFDYVRNSKGEKLGSVRDMCGKAYARTTSYVAEKAKRARATSRRERTISSRNSGSGPFCPPRA